MDSSNSNDENNTSSEIVSNAVSNNSINGESVSSNNETDGFEKTADGISSSNRESGNVAKKEDVTEASSSNNVKSTRDSGSSSSNVTANRQTESISSEAGNNQVDNMSSVDNPVLPMDNGAGKSKTSNANKSSGTSLGHKVVAAGGDNTKPATINAISDNQAVCLFAFDSSYIGENEILNKLAACAKDSGKKVVINAYADEVGTETYNQALSQRRANAVLNYFVGKGVKAVVITAKGNGETTKFATRAENRRAEIMIQ